MKTNLRASIVTALVAGAAFFGSEGAAHAFSTGGHFTATENGLRREQFSSSAIRAVQVANYTVDHFSSKPDKLNTGSSQLTSNVTFYFHFDELQDPRALEANFERSVLATKTVVARAVAANDVRAIIDVLGIESHSIEDFYAHSTFADVEWPRWVGRHLPTFFDIPRDIFENRVLRTRLDRGNDLTGMMSDNSIDTWSGEWIKRHPLYTAYFPPYYPKHKDGNTVCDDDETVESCGINHDSANRRFNLLAMMQATEAMVELTERVKGMVPPAMWNSVKTFNGGEGVEQAWARAQGESMAAGQWGSGGDSHLDQIVIAYEGFKCDDADCPQSQWENVWHQNLFELWSAAADVRVEGGVGTSVQPPSNVALVTPEVPQDPPASIAGSYRVTWGTTQGTLVLAAGPQGRMTGNLRFAGGAVQPVITVKSFRGGIDMAIGGTLYARVFPTGVGKDRGLAGTLRDNAHGGVPDGFTAAMLTLAVNPNQPGTQMR